MANTIWMKTAVTVLVLVQLTQGQPVLADAASLAEATPVAAEAAFQPSVQDVLLKVCQANGYGEACAKTLLGMVWVESNNISTAIGDGGRARGYFQIHYKLHNITTDCAEDLVCSADWTIQYLERNAYPKYVNYAVQCHNSCNAGNGYAARAARHGERLWHEPLTITQAAPINLKQLVAEEQA